MINLPDNFKTKIINRYGEEGYNWLNRIDNVVDKYKKQFMLKNIRLVDEISMNVVLFAESLEFGNIVIKIGAPSKTIISEMHTIELSQFIRNELDNINLDNEREFDEIISLVSKYYEEDKTLILETLYIYIINKVIFYIESKDTPNRIIHNINVCKKILQYIH